MSEPVPSVPTPPAITQQALVIDLQEVARQTAAILEPKFEQTAAQVAQSFHDKSIAAINGVAADVADNKQAIEATAASIGQSFADRLVSDTWLQRALVLLVAGVSLIGGLALLVFYLAGSHQASDAVGWLGLLFGAPLAAAIHQAIGGPGAAKVPVAPVATATTLLQPAQFVSGIGPVGDTTALKLSGQIPMSSTQIISGTAAQ